MINLKNMRNIKQIIITIAVCFAVTGFVGIAYSWTAPTAEPPGNNVSAPINISTNKQIFAGNKILNMGVAGANVLTVNGGFVLNGVLNVQNLVRISYNQPAYGVAISAAPGGGWSRRFGFSTSDGSALLGGYGGHGYSAETINFLWIGRNHDDYIVRMDVNTNNTYFNGKVGIGVQNPSANLDVNGTVKISGGSPGVGKVLTSDASGNASWQAPGGSANSGPFLGESLAFSQTGSGNFSANLEPGTYIIEMKGAGGGGGGASWNGSNPESGGGGGEGETVYHRVTLDTATTVNGNVGVGGYGGSATFQTGGNGGNTTMSIGGTSLVAYGGKGGCYIDNGGHTLCASTVCSCGFGGGVGKSATADTIRIAGGLGGMPITNTDDEDSVPGGNGGGPFGGRGGTRRGGSGNCSNTTNATSGVSGGGGGGASHDQCTAGAGGDGYVYIWKQ